MAGCGRQGHPLAAPHGKHFCPQPNETSTPSPDIAMSSASQFPAFDERPVPGTVVLFDVDGTLTPARKVRGPPCSRDAPADGERS